MRNITGSQIDNMFFFEEVLLKFHIDNQLIQRMIF